MTILLVDTDSSRIRQTAQVLQTLFPRLDGLSTTDPLLAAKYAFEHSVDVLITGLNMRRMNGIQLSAFLQEKSPNAKVFFFASEWEWETFTEKENYLWIPLPLTEKSLRDALEMPAAS